MEYKTKSNKQTHRNNRMVVSRGERGSRKGEVGKGDQIGGSRRKLNFAWQVCNKVHSYYDFVHQKIT